MDKLVVSSDEVAAVADSPAGLPAEVRLPRIVQWPAQILLACAALVLPLLCLATIGVWLVVRRREARVRHAWLQYCCALLVVSGLFSTAAAVLVFTFLSRPPLPSAPLSLQGPVALPMAAAAQPLSPRELASRVENAVFIVARDSKWLKPTRESLAYSGFGTAVLLFAGEKEYLLATSRHVLDGEDWPRAKPYRGEAVLLDRSGGGGRAQIAGRYKELDLLLLRMPRSSGTERFAQAVVPFETIDPGERVMVFGHPEGLFFSLSDGLVSRRDPPGQIQITAPVSPGASGGPVYDLRGRLLGIVCSMIDRQRSPHAENLNFAVRADSLLHAGQWELDPAGASALNEFIAASEAAATEAAAPQVIP